VKEAWDNVRGVIATPRKAVELFGGNLMSQLLFAMVLGPRCTPTASHCP